MKERFEEMTLDQLDAIHDVMCYLYPPMEGMDETAARLWHDLEDVRTQKFTEYQSVSFAVSQKLRKRQYVLF